MCGWGIRRRAAAIAGVVALGTTVAACGQHATPGATRRPARPVLAAAPVNLGDAAGAARSTSLLAGVPVAGAAGGGGLLVADTNGAVDTENATGASGVSDGTGASGQAVVDIVATPSGHGYWLVGAGGAVRAFGWAGRFGSLSGSTTQPDLTPPVVGMATTPRGRGYWLVDRNGGVHAFGLAGNHGSATALHVVSPFAGVVATPDGRGYWLFTRAGRVIGFGSAAFEGSASHRAPTAPMVAMAATPDGRGYWLAARNGQVYAFGDAAHYGQDTTVGSPALDLVRTADGRGYWLLYANGTIESFGDAHATPTMPVPSRGESLAGEVVTIDPGHDGGNGADPSYIDQPVPSGPGMEKACDTTGTETDAGYTEASFNFDVATRLATLLRGQGATVVLTRPNNTGVGPCVNIRAAIGNEARSDAAVSIHADGGPPGGRGFAVLTPALFSGYNDAVVPPSDRLGTLLRNSFEQLIEPSTYDGVDGLQVRNDLGGLNLSTVPKVLIECANMRNATDAALVTSPVWRQEAAQRMDVAFTNFLTTTGP